MKKTLALLIMILSFSLSYGGKISDEVKKIQNSESFIELSLLKNGGTSVNVEILNEVKVYNELNVDQILLNWIINDKPKNIKLNIPGLNSKVLLYRFEISDGINIITSSGSSPELNDIIHYRGIIEGDDNSIVNLTFTRNDINGIISNNSGDFVLGKVNGSNRYIIYNDNDLLLKRNFNCDAIDLSDNQTKQQPNSQKTSAVKCVQWYYETDYDIFVNKGSVANVVSYVQGVFAQVSTLYANDGMSISLKTLFVWDTVDPYNGTSTTTLLSQFGQYRTSFNGDLAHLLGYVGNGGVAYVNSMCSSNNSNKMAYSDINATYSLVPTYSWTIEVVAHESGHNVASKHTHDCAWNGNNTPIDGCGPAAGYTVNCTAGPLPTNGGTIMSYCHLISSIGINFNNGFGPQPTTLMLNTIAAKTCLVTCDTTGSGGGGGGGTGCSSAPSQPSLISGSASACSGTTKTYSVVADSNATSYSWQLPSGWIGSSTTNSITVITDSTSGTISVVAINSCGTSPSRTLNVNIRFPLQTPSPISGPNNPCSGTTNTYSVISDPNATSYTWQMVSGWSGTSTTNIINITAGTSSGNIVVLANSVCGQSSPSILYVEGLTVPANPSFITGPTIVCPNQQGVQYFVDPSPNVTSYIWTSPTGSTITAGSTTSVGNTLTTNSNVILINFSNKKGKISVKASNSCGTSGARNLNVNMNCLPNVSDPNNFSINVIPNPTNDFINIVMESSIERNIKILLYDVTKKLVYNSELGLNYGTNNYSIDITNFSSGIYILEVSGSDISNKIKVIKE